VTETRVSVDVPINLTVVFDLLILLVALVLDLQLLTRLVQHVFQSLVHGQVPPFSRGLLAWIGKTVTIQFVNRRLPIPAGVLFDDLLQMLPCVVAPFRFRRVVPVLVL